jgi:hypothetical protein
MHQPPTPLRASRIAPGGHEVLDELVGNFNDDLHRLRVAQEGG